MVRAYIFVTLALPLLALAASLLEQRAVSCTGSFSSVTVQSFFSAFNPGWNLGNTLDATPTETSWGNAAASGQNFDDIKAAGFKGVRVPGMIILCYQSLRLTGRSNLGVSFCRWG